MQNAFLCAFCVSTVSYPVFKYGLFLVSTYEYLFPVSMFVHFVDGPS